MADKEKAAQDQNRFEVEEEFPEEFHIEGPQQQQQLGTTPREAILVEFDRDSNRLVGHKDLRE